MLPEEERAWDEFLAHEARGVALRADFWRPVLAVWQVVRHPRRSPRRVVAVLAAVVMIAGMAVLAVNAPGGGCTLRVMAVRGEKPHEVCEREGRPT